MTQLSQHEIDACRQTFAQYDRTGRNAGCVQPKFFSSSVAGLLLPGAGIVSTDELPSILTSLGYSATEEDVAAQTHQVPCLLARHLSLLLLPFVGTAAGYSLADQLCLSCRVMARVVEKLVLRMS